MSPPVVGDQLIVSHIHHRQTGHSLVQPVHDGHTGLEVESTCGRRQFTHVRVRTRQQHCCQNNSSGRQKTSPVVGQTPVQAHVRENAGWKKSRRGLDEGFTIAQSQANKQEMQYQKSGQEHQQSSPVSQHQQTSPVSQHQQSSRGSQNQQSSRASQNQQSSRGSQNQQSSRASQNQQSSRGSQNQQSSRGSKNQQSSPVSQNQQSSRGSQNQQSSRASENQQSSRASQNQQSSPVSQNQQSSRASQNQQSSPVSQNQQSSRASENQQSSRGSQNQQSSPVSQNQQSSRGSQNQQSSRASENQQSSRNSQTQQSSRASENQQSSRGSQNQQSSRGSHNQQSSRASHNQQSCFVSQNQTSPRVCQRLVTPGDVCGLQDGTMSTYLPGKTLTCNKNNSNDDKRTPTKTPCYHTEGSSCPICKHLLLGPDQIDMLLSLVVSDCPKSDIVGCCKLALQCSHSSNALRNYLVACKYRLYDVMDRILQFIRLNFLCIAQTKEFLCLPLDFVLIFMEDDNLKVEKELDMFVVALTWVDFNKQKRIPCAGHILNCIRYGCIPPEDIAAYVEPNLHLFTGPSGAEALVKLYKYHVTSTRPQQTPDCLAQMPHKRTMPQTRDHAPGAPSSHVTSGGSGHAAPAKPMPDTTSTPRDGPPGSKSPTRVTFRDHSSTAPTRKPSPGSGSRSPSEKHEGNMSNNLTLNNRGDQLNSCETASTQHHQRVTRECQTEGRAHHDVPVSQRAGLVGNMAPGHCSDRTTIGQPGHDRFNTKYLVDNMTPPHADTVDVYPQPMSTWKTLYSIHKVGNQKQSQQRVFQIVRANSGPVINVMCRQQPTLDQ